MAVLSHDPLTEPLVVSDIDHGTCRCGSGQFVPIGVYDHQAEAFEVGQHVAIHNNDLDVTGDALLANKRVLGDTGVAVLYFMTDFQDGIAHHPSSCGTIVNTEA